MSQPPPPPAAAQPLAQQFSGQPPASPGPPGGAPPIRVPALSPDKITEYSTLFEKSGAENGFLSGLVAKQIFERARLPNEVLGRIWGLSDTQGRGSLNVTEFVIAMHLLASYKSGQMRGVPSTLPPGLFEAASRRPPVRVGSGSRPGSAVPAVYNARPQSPITRQPQVSTPLSLSAQSTGEPWAITPADKARFDTVFATVDRQGRGFITGEQAVEFFGNARLPEDTLAQIWDLADINSEGQLNKDEFAVAMYLIRQQRGMKDGRGNLPATLPPNLVPPSMRKQHIPPPQPTAPAFENAAPTKPRSAADDLFGLDAFGPPPSVPAIAPTQVAQSTGGTDAGPFANPPGVLTPQTTSTTFKPFVPTSSFGRGIIPQSTGSPAPQAKAPAEDLLGDADPEVNSRITNEASELGNLSNQVSSLSKQMTELHGERKQAEQELSNASSQKKAFEGRLAQLRSLYEKEVQEVKTLKEQLATSKTDIKRLQSDMAIIDGSHQDLSTQHQQLRAALESDQRENASLKERIRQLNQEVDQLKPQLEKLKSDARQQKGLVAINKKQLATNEAERDRIKAEIAAAHKEVEDALREAEESARQLEASKRELEEARNAPVPSVPAVKSPPVVSPAPSTNSNPFFRRTTETSFSPPIAETEPKDSQSAFDSIFGPSFNAAAPAPATSFSSQSPPPGEQANVPRIESPASSAARDLEPPAPPQSRQISSAALPFRRPLDREDSISSSVKVAGPTSRLSPNDTPQALTPTASTPSPVDRKESGEDPFTAAAPDEEQESVRRTLPQPAAPESNVDDVFGKPSADTTREIPGAFPASQVHTPGADPTVLAGAAAAATVATGIGVAAAATNGDKPDDAPPPVPPKTPDQNFDDFFGGPAHQRSASQKAADFESAFADIDKPKPGEGQEFPDIQEFDADDDSSEYSDDEAPMKFDDDFNARSPPRDSPVDVKSGKQPEMPPSNNMLAPRPVLGGPSSTGSSLPGAESQQSPPTYGDAVPEDNPTHFPREYKGLLPEREDPTSPPPTAGASTHPAPPPGGNPPEYGPEATPRSPSDNKATEPPPTKAAPFDFDLAFTGVGSAPVEDDDDDDDEDNDAPFGQPKHSAHEFDPTFDSPPQTARQQFPSSAPVANGGPKSGLDDFDSAVTAPSISQQGAQQSTTSPVPHDWDALFAPLNTNGAAAAQPTNDFPPVQSQAAEISTPSPPRAQSGVSSPAPAPSSPPPAATSSPPPSASLQPKPQRPQPGRALSAGTEHDDPILKRLTAMGWSREESLAALERFDYNIDKVSLKKAS